MDMILIGSGLAVGFLVQVGQWVIFLRLGKNAADKGN